MEGQWMVHPAYNELLFHTDLHIHSPTEMEKSSHLILISA